MYFHIWPDVVQRHRANLANHIKITKLNSRSLRCYSLWLKVNQRQMLSRGKGLSILVKHCLAYNWPDLQIPTVNEASITELIYQDPLYALYSIWELTHLLFVFQNFVILSLCKCSAGNGHSLIHSFIHSQSNPTWRLQDKASPRRPSNATVPRAVQWLRSQVKGQSAPALIWSLMAGSAVLCLCLTRTPPPRPARPGAARQGGSNGTGQEATPGAETPPEEGGKSEEEEEEGEGEVYKVKPEESEDEDKNDPGDEEQEEEEDEEEVCKVKPEESEDEDKNDPGDEEQAEEEEEEEDERADVPRQTDASGMRKRK